VAGDHKGEIQQKAARIIDWLREHRSEFEGDGIAEESLAASTSLSEDEVREAVDYLENHEDVVRYPQGDTAPSRFLLKPARNWANIREAAGT
jgi:DNA-binding GntR family transcriptional regulator